MFIAIETARLWVRRFQEEDLPAFLEYRSDPLLARWQSWSALSEEQGRDFLASMAEAEPGQAGGGFQFAIADRADNALLGDIYLRLLDYDTRQAELGYTLARAAQGQGYAQEAVGAVIQYVFAELHLHRITAIVDQENLASVRLLERLGFRHEGSSRQSFFNHGMYRDEFQYALLASEWPGREIQLIA